MKNLMGIKKDCICTKYTNLSFSFYLICSTVLTILPMPFSLGQVIQSFNVNFPGSPPLLALNVSNLMYIYLLR